MPSHTLTPFRVESRISAAYLPQGRFRTPRNARPAYAGRLLLQRRRRCPVRGGVLVPGGHVGRELLVASLVPNVGGGGVAGAWRWQLLHGTESVEPVEEPGEWRGNAAARWCVVMARRAKKLTTPVVSRGDVEEEKKKAWDAVFYVCVPYTSNPSRLSCIESELADLFI